MFRQAVVLPATITRVLRGVRPVTDAPLNVTAGVKRFAKR
jgi:hypothetical protein